MHRRLRPRRHKLAYDVYAALFDLDELPALDRSLFAFGYNRAAPMSFHDRDHGLGDGLPLRQWIETQLRAAGIPVDGGPIRLLCYPRVFGYVFNPISVYFCYRASGALAAIVHEVNNTFHDRHTYVIPADRIDGDVVTQNCEKKMYVSPFIEMGMTYDFRIKPPGDDVTIAIAEGDADGALLYASFHGRRRPLGAWDALAYVARFPLLTIKIMAAIHWEALKLWLKGVPLVKRPLPAANSVSLIKPTTSAS
jgi:DUF1365 family protein